MLILHSENTIFISPVYFACMNLYMYIYVNLYMYI